MNGTGKPADTFNLEALLALKRQQGHKDAAKVALLAKLNIKTK